MNKSFFIQAVQSLSVGGTASLANFGLLALLVEKFHFLPQEANLPTLLLGSLIQFWGHRHWVFYSRAGMSKNSGYQLRRFIAGEIVSCFFGNLLFNFFTENSQGHYILARVASTSLIYWGISFPLWRFIFSESGNESRFENKVLRRKLGGA